MYDIDAVMFYFLMIHYLFIYSIIDTRMANQTRVSNIRSIG